MDATDPVARARQTRMQTMARVGMSNLVGAVLVFLYFFILPTDEGDAVRVSREDVVSLWTFAALMAVGMPAGFVLGSRIFRPVEQWLATQRSPDHRERSLTLRTPARLAGLSFAVWSVAAVLFGSLNITFDNPARVVIRIVVGTLLGGLTTSAACFLLVERFMRPVFAEALQGAAPTRSRTLGVRPRLLLSWSLGSAIPLLGILTAPLAPNVDLDALVPAMAFLAAIGLLAGGTLLVVAARSVAEPIDSVRSGLEQVEAGHLATAVPVDDGGEIGRLQAGFNRMAAGLREREQLREVFGRHVGEEVARQALDGAARLGGEQREVTVMFVDLVGSTALAQTRSPAEVVELLNRFFGAVVHTTSDEGGWVNKFEGDGALCVFGAPAVQSDHATRGLRAARTLRRALTGLGVEAGIGVSSGTVVAGNVGAEERYEYTVIGDPVNEAARLTEAAKSHLSGVLASEASVTAAGTEAAHWAQVGSYQLRGRALPTVGYAPAQSGAEASALDARVTPSSSTS